MPTTSDPWYIRLPDGRVLRAAGPTIIRQQLATGRLPSGTRFRRSEEDDWKPLERMPELADAVSTNGSAPATIASRLDAAHLHLAGVRQLLDELIGALDSTISSRKLWLASFVGLLLGGLWALTAFERFSFALWPVGLGWALAGAALLLITWLVVVLSKMTFTEVSQLRRASWRDGLSGSLGPTILLSLTLAVFLSLFGAAILGLRFLPGWLLTMGEADNLTVQIGAQTVSVAGTVLEFLLWPLLILLLPLGAAVVVESGSVFSALGQWGSLVGRKAGRLLLAEGLALSIAALSAVPLALVGGALASRQDGPAFIAGDITRRVLLGALTGLPLAFVVVANVFIYLSLRYEERD